GPEPEHQLGAAAGRRGAGLSEYVSEWGVANRGLPAVACAPTCLLLTTHYSLLAQPRLQHGGRLFLRQKHELEQQRQVVGPDRFELAHVHRHDAALDHDMVD